MNPGDSPDVAFRTTSVSVVATATDHNARWSTNGTDHGLTTGGNTVVVTVTAQDGTTTAP